jgi:hypothetical protein
MASIDSVLIVSAKPYVHGNPKLVGFMDVQLADGTTTVVHASALEAAGWSAPAEPAPEPEASDVPASGAFGVPPEVPAKAKARKK